MKKWAVSVSIALFVGGCASIPADRYGVARLRLEGMEELDPEALRACLATSERDAFGINFGTSTELACGEPPFDGGRLHLRLWSWGWKEWPTLDLAVFERDIERIERWYRARGFYDARVLSTRLDPPAAASSDRVVGEGEEAVCEREGEGEGCKVEVTVTVDEGEPLLVESIGLSLDANARGLTREDLVDALELEEGERFDEALYERSKEALVRALRNEGYACATVAGDVQVDPDARRARVRFDVTPGPPSVFGEVTIHVSGEGEQNIPKTTVLGAADIDARAPFSPEKIANAQRAIYALGAFSSVQVEAMPRRGEAGACEGVVDVRIELTPGRALRYGVGGGIRSGILNVTGSDEQDVPQWDVHLLAFVEHRNLFGGLRRLRIEERPKLVFRSQFPRPVGETEDAEAPTLGNELRYEFRQPAFIEPRTTLSLHGRWDLGPDPNQPNIFRHDLDQGLVLSRPFFGGRVLISNAFRVNLYRIPPALNPNTVFDVSSNYQVLFLEQYAQLDLRDDARRPRKGLFLSVGAQEAGLARSRLGLSSWRYYRVTPEARVYAPLPAGMVLAGRFAVGAMMIQDGDDALDRVSRELGPTRYRLRGGGPTSHRGYDSATLGWFDAPAEQGPTVPNDDGDPATLNDPALYPRTSGGVRRWEASLELRIPIDEDIGAVAFADMGDVNRAEAFRFNYIHLAVGVGFRYQTIVGPLRVDFGVLIPDAQVIGANDAPYAGELSGEDTIGEFPNYWTRNGSRVPGAINVTIGEAF